MEEDSITIMVVRQSGKIRTVKIAPKRLYIFFSGLSGLVLAFFVLLYGYIEAYQRNSGLSTTVRSIIEAQEAAPVQKAQSAIPQDTFLAENTASAGGEDTEITKDPAEDHLSRAPSGENDTDAEQSSGIAIDEFRTTPTHTPPGIKFSFRLSNVEREAVLSGFLAVVGTGGNGRSEVFGVFPDAPIGNSGELVDFRRGDWFSIRRFKYVQGNLPINEKIREYTQLTVYVYSENGKLILRKTLDIASNP